MVRNLPGSPRPWRNGLFRHSMGWMLALGVLSPALATDVTVVGLFPSKAVVSVNGGAPKTIAVGQRTPEGVMLVGIGGETATLDVDGKRRTLKMGQMYQAAAGGTGSVTLQADGRGHFVADGAVNGGSMRFLIDTGATLISIPASEAKRVGVNYLQGSKTLVNTAGGPTPAYVVKLDTVRVGAVTLNNVDAVVIERGLDVNLLGMSFLNRMEMRRDGESMVLTKRY